MTNEALPTAAEADAMLVALDRLMETNAAVAAAQTETEKYWAGSAWASVSRDYKAGRVRSIKVGR